MSQAVQDVVEAPLPRARSSSDTSAQTCSQVVIAAIYSMTTIARPTISPRFRAW